VGDACLTAADSIRMDGILSPFTNPQGFD